MKRIFKYELPRDGEVVTINANVIKWLDVQEQDGQPMIWAVVDQDEDTAYPLSEYEIIAWGTGWEFPDELDRCRYMGTVQDGAGYVWHYFMQEKSKSYMPAGTGIATAPLQGVDYWNNWVTTTPAGVYDYGITISCGDADSVISALESKVYNDYSIDIDNLQSSITTVTNCNTATVKACTQK